MSTLCILSAETEVTLIKAAEEFSNHAQWTKLLARIRNVLYAKINLYVLDLSTLLLFFVLSLMK